MNKILVVCGPTAIGKTELALNLAEKFNGELISADSRQVYREMDIGTGKDLPPISNFHNKVGLAFPISNFKKQKIGCYLVNGIRIWGYDLVGPKENFSVSQYIKIANKIIKNIWSRKKPVILVGGTGLYVKGVIDGFETFEIPPDLELRKSLVFKGVYELFEILAAQDPIKAATMNSSDRKNPRRLLRAIEIANTNFKYKFKSQKLSINPLFIGLTMAKQELENRIEKRVNSRLRAGQELEVKKLLANGVTWEMQSMQALGYKEWKGFFEGKISKPEVVRFWTLDELKYAKRQMTWFKKDKRVSWFRPATKDWKEDIEKLVKKWQNESYA